MTEINILHISAYERDLMRAHRPDVKGRYVVMGRAWTWTPVYPYGCDRIAGHIPDAGTA